MPLLHLDRIGTDKSPRCRENAFVFVEINKNAELARMALLQEEMRGRENDFEKLRGVKEQLEARIKELEESMYAR